MDPNSTDSGGVNWSQVLLTGLSAAIDSQIAQPYAINNPVYNTQYGPGGQGQLPYYGGTASASVSSTNPMLLLVLGGVVLYFLLKK